MIIDCNKICEWFHAIGLAAVELWAPSKEICEGCPCCLEKAKKQK